MQDIPTSETGSEKPYQNLYDRCDQFDRTLTLHELSIVRAAYPEKVEAYSKEMWKTPANRQSNFMITEKYFTPSIEDIRTGYEFELLPKHAIDREDKEIFWQETVWSLGFAISTEDALRADRIRVPYLTKEQIEKEGWTYLKDNYGRLEFMKWEVEVVYHPDKHMMEVITTGQKPHITIYWGECKDINTFRQIIKLLGI